MSNAFPKSVVVEFNNQVEGFEPDNIMARQSMVRDRSGEEQFQSNFREWQTIEMISTTVDGLDISASLNKDVTELAIPYDIDTIANVPFTLNAQELNSPVMLRNKIDSAFKALSARVNRDVANKVKLEGGITVVQSGALQTYNDIAAAEVAMLRRDVAPETMKSMVMNMSDYRTVSGNLAGRETLTPKALTAYEKSAIGEIAGFETFRTNFAPNIAAAGGGATTVDGAQSLVPAPNQVTASGNTENLDNRFMNLTVDNSAGIVAGDRFTAGVNEVSLINKEDTGNLQTFTVTEVVDGTTITISPAPISVVGSTQAEKEYGNVTGPLADTQALTWLNIAAAPLNAFWENDMICLNAGSLNVDSMAGLSVMKDSTDSGIQIILASEGDLGTFTGRYRLTAFYGVTVKDPLRCGVLLANQT